MQIIPAVLTNTSDEAIAQFDRLRGQTEWVQIDVMDGQFVPSRSFSLEELPPRAMDGFSVEAHLMAFTPVQYFDICKDLGVRRVYVHFGATRRTDGTEELAGVLETMAQYGFERGVAISPETDPEVLRPYIEDIDVVLLLTVVPGKQGQQFIPSVLEKISVIKKMKPEIAVGVDGGVSKETLPDVLHAGADFACIGSAISRSDNPIQMLQTLTAQAQEE